MATNDDDNFFSRWSRRKVQVRSGEPLPPEPPPAPAPAPVVVAAPVAVVAPVAPVAEQPPEPPPALTLDDVARLTPESDYSAFVAKSVSPDVRNAAVKKLFSDPHYNIMDGLDIYIDDYSKPSPLSMADMAKMVGAQFLKLVDDPNEVKPAATVSTEQLEEPAELPSEVAQAEPEAEEALPDDNNDTPVPETPDPHDDHADLQLQPDHAPEPEGSGRGPG